MNFEPTQTFSFETICPAYRNDLLSMAKRYTGQEHTAEDLVQETYLKAFRHWDSFKQETDNVNRDVKVWLKKILTNTFFTEYQRDQKRSQMHEDYGTEFNEVTESDFEGSDRLHKVLDKLKPQYKEILDLHYMQDKSYNEIAELLNIKFVQVQKRLYRARQYVKTYYEQKGLNPCRIRG